MHYLLKGNQILNDKGEVVSFAGNSLFWSNDYYGGNGFYNKNVIQHLKKDWKSDIIRIPMTADPYITIALIICVYNDNVWFFVFLFRSTTSEN